MAGRSHRLGLLLGLDGAWWIETGLGGRLMGLDIGFVAGLGWGCAFGLAVALAVALWPHRSPSPPSSEPQASGQRGDRSQPTKVQVFGS